jgi:hypothetical protein
LGKAGHSHDLANAVCMKLFGIAVEDHISIPPCRLDRVQYLRGPMLTLNLFVQKMPAGCWLASAAYM